MKGKNKSKKTCRKKWLGWYNQHKNRKAMKQNRIKYVSHGTPMFKLFYYIGAIRVEHLYYNHWRYEGHFRFRMWHPAVWIVAMIFYVSCLFGKVISAFFVTKKCMAERIVIEVERDAEMDATMAEIRESRRQVYK